MSQPHLSALSTEELLKRKAQLESRKSQQNFSALSTEELLKRKAELEARTNQQPPRPSPEDPTAGQRISSVGKAALAGGIGGLADLATAPYNLGAAAHNLQREHIDHDVLKAAARFNPEIPTLPYEGELPLIPSATEAIDRGIDSATGSYTQTPEDQKWLNEGVKFGASLASPGGLAKAGVKGMSALGTLRPAGLAGAFAAGATGEALRDEGAAASFGGSLGAAAGVEALAGGVRNFGKGAIKLAGFGKRNLDLDAIESAQKLKIDVPHQAFTSGKAANLATQVIGKAPILGDKLKDKFTQASKDYKGAFENLLEDVGPQKTEEVASEIAKKYKHLEASVPQADTVLAKELLGTIQDLEASLDSTFHSAPTKALLDVAHRIKGQIVEDVIPFPEGFEKMAPEVQEKVREVIHAQTQLKPVSVKKLVRQKAELNKYMKDRNLFDRTDGDTLNLLKRIQSATDRELEHYGTTQNEPFLKAWKEANESYARTAKRESLDDFLSAKLKPDSKEDVAYGSLANLLERRDSQKRLKNSLGEQNYKKLQDFVNVARAMQALNKNNPNPSGSATVGFLLGLAYTPLRAIKGATLGYGAYQLLTSKRFLNLAIKYAKEPSQSAEKQLGEIVQERTGVPLQSLIKEMNTTESRETPGG
jgi:hypothetical protein